MRDDSAQGIAHPEAASRTPARVTELICGGPSNAAQLYDGCTRIWSPRARIRVDPDRTHNYSSTASIPAQAPQFPWAIYLTGSDHRFRILGFDFDIGRHGRDVALADSDRFARQLTELGVAYLRAHSGPFGGQHVWVRLSDPGAGAAEVRQLAHALSQHYPSMDTSALRNPVSGTLRPPGAPHRAGGASVPHLRGAALKFALRKVNRGTAPEVVGWLLARHPHVSQPPPARPARTSVQIVSDSTGPRLDRPRRPLPRRTLELLASAPTAGIDRSAVGHSILLSMARAGHTLADARVAVSTAPGLCRLRDDAERGHDDTERQWSRALAQAAAFTSTATPTSSEPIDAELDAIERALIRSSAHWGRRGGASDERILHALNALARKARTRVLDVDCRRLAQAAALDASTVSRRLRVLAEEGWVTLTTPSSGTRAATWTLNVPTEKLMASISRATQGEPAPRPAPTPLTHHTHCLLYTSLMGGLGGSTARIHWHYRSGLTRVEDLSTATGYAAPLVERSLALLQAAGLLVPVHSSEGLLRLLDVAANRRGVRGTNASRTARHLVDRERQP
ncbi:hypothetical protein Pd630_LPD10002 (plasmid) [Rhodococcus opacus PD630]|nr:hypothetical protein Pd630_LPD10002 [Rhodococcus opacus PD630]